MSSISLDLPPEANTALPQAAYDPDTLMSIYQRMTALSEIMVEAARGGDWDTVTETEKQVAALAADMAARPTTAPRDESDRQARMALLKRMLANDAIVRELAQPWMQELSQILKPGRATGSPFSNARY
jgi:flagellar protein FliT